MRQTADSNLSAKGTSLLGGFSLPLALYFYSVPPYKLVYNIYLLVFLPAEYLTKVFFHIFQGVYMQSAVNHQLEFKQ